MGRGSDDCFEKSSKQATVWPQPSVGACSCSQGVNWQGLQRGMGLSTIRWTTAEQDDTACWALFFTACLATVVFRCHMLWRPVSVVVVVIRGAWNLLFWFGRQIMLCSTSCRSIAYRTYLRINAPSRAISGRIWRPQNVSTKKPAREQSCTTAPTFSQMSVRLDDNGTLVRVSHTTLRTAAGVRGLTKAVELSATRGFCTLACRSNKEHTHKYPCHFPMLKKDGIPYSASCLFFPFHLELPALLNMATFSCVMAFPVHCSVVTATTARGNKIPSDAPAYRPCFSGQSPARLTHGVA